MKKLLFFLAIAASGGWWYYQTLQPKADPAGGSAQTPAKGGGGKGGRMDTGPVPIVSGTVEKRDVPIYLSGLGNVQGFNTVTVRSRVDGQLMKVAFEEGQEVHVGDLLAKIDPKPFQAALDQALAKRREDEALLNNARVTLDRNIALLPQKAVAKQDVDTQKALVDQLAATVNADDAAIESATVQLDYTTITAPIEGRVGIRQVDQGNVVRASDATGIVVITQLHPIAVVFTLPEQNLPLIQQEMKKGTLKVIAVGRDNDSVLSTGSLAVVDNQIDITTGTIKLKAAFPNDDLKLWPGQFVNARLQLTTNKDATVVPASVVQRGPEGTYAFVIQDEALVEIRKVKVSSYEGGLALIEAGLKPGDRVVVDGQYRLQTGSRIKEEGTDTPGKDKPGVAADQGRHKPRA